MVWLRFLTMLFLVALFVGTSCGDAVYYPPSEHDGGWRKNTDPDFIRSLGIDPERLEELGRYSQSVPNGNWKPYSDYKGTIVIKDGWIIGEWYNTPEARDFKTYISSNGKSFAMSCFGIMVRDSQTSKIDLKIYPEDRVYDKRWLPEGFPLSDPQKAGITFEEIFRHTSGLCPERTGTGEAIEQGRNEWTDYREWIVGHDAHWPSTGKDLLYSGTSGGVGREGSLGRVFGWLLQCRIWAHRTGLEQRLRDSGSPISVGPAAPADRLLGHRLSRPSQRRPEMVQRRRTAHDSEGLRPVRLFPAS